MGSYYKFHCREKVSIETGVHTISSRCLPQYKVKRHMRTVVGYEEKLVPDNK